MASFCSHTDMNRLSTVAKKDKAVCLIVFCFFNG